MGVVVCPHCKSHRFPTSKVSQGVVAVMPCPVCNELAVFFRNKVIPLSRRIIEQGSFEERKSHLAGIIAEFLEDGDIPFSFDQLQRNHGASFEPGDQGVADRSELDHEDENPISDAEFDRFVRVELRCIDNASYFRRHFL